MFRSLGYNFTPQDIASMLREIDKNTNDELKFEEFQRLLKKQEEKLREGEDELIDAFRGIALKYHYIVFDRDGNGVITAEELKQVMLSLGESLSDQDIEDMIKAAAGDPDGSFVTLKDFVSIYLVLHAQ